ncbi:hypothetical protein ACPV5O_15980 [Vibrio maritimus]|uniref:hypothetical protein n=1 Tax=Vibrio maritimus TaxID=990268 RepID=UPI004068F5E7
MNQLHLENVLNEANAELFAIVSKGEIHERFALCQFIVNVVRRLVTSFFHKVLKRS